MKTMKPKILVAAVLTLGIALAAPVSAVADGIPTVDWVAVENARKQIDNQIEQISKLKEQIEAMKGLRNIGTIAKDTFKNDIPKELRDLYRQAGINAGKNKPGGNYTQTAQTNKNVLEGQLRNLSKFLDSNKKRLDEINRLTESARNAGDLKTAADLRNQLSSYAIQLQNQQAEIENTERLYRMQQEVEHRQRAGLEACQIRQITSGNYAACNK